MTAHEIATNPVAQKAYIEWLEQPMTKMLIDLVDSEGKCERPHPNFINGQIALMAMGENVGWHGAMQRLRSLHRVPMNHVEELVATYGAEKIMDELYKNLPDKANPGTQKGEPQ